MDFIKTLNLDWKTIIIVICIIVGAAILSRIIRWFISRSFQTASEKLKIDPTRYKFFKNAVSLIIWLVAFAAIISLIPRLKALSITLFAGAGIMVAVIGFAAQQAFSNIINGIFIVIFKPFRVGDMIKVGGLDYGIVEDITLRHTIINNFENKRIIIPNSVVGSETIVNDSIEDAKVCRWIELGISYDSDLDLATRIIQEEAGKHPGCIDARTEEQKQSGVPQVVVRLLSFGDFSIDLRAFVWTDSPYKAMQMHSDINRAIKKRFDAEGVEIPFPYRTVVYKKDLPANSRSEADE
ncbi:MAG: mechanosensitive ion channel family protein [Candidatus Delongbacteria bacterium]|nr:mechanosensitive ion channel family protein [Candidatus Delongbacteria bacterium]